MDTRKVLEMGGGTVLISLPKSWAKKNGIVRGSSVAVEEISGRRLMVKPIGEKGTKVEDREVVIEYPRESLSYVTNDVTGAYLMGSNAIRIDGQGMTMQCLLDPAVLDPEKIVRRMASLIAGMLRDSAEGAKSDPALLALVG